MNIYTYIVITIFSTVPLMGVEAIGVVVRWFGGVERKDDCDWVKGCTVLEVEGPKPRGRPKKTWMEVVKRDMKEMGLRREDAQDSVEWRRRLKGGGPANPGEPGNRAVKPYVCVYYVLQKIVRCWGETGTPTANGALRCHTVL